MGGVTPFRTHYTPSPPNPVTEQGWQQEFALVQQGEAHQAAGDYAGAITAYTQARTMEPADLHVLYHMAECAEATGDDADAVSYYRAAVYTDAPPPLQRTFREGNGSKLMPFVLALARAGQAQEAMTVYNYGVARIDFDAVTGKQGVDVVLPQFGGGPGQAPYTPQGLEAMAHLAVAVSTNDMILRCKEAQAAVTLAPDAAIAHYYLGKSLYALGDNAGAKPELQQAVQPGDDQTVTLAKGILQFLH